MLPLKLKKKYEQRRNKILHAYTEIIFDLTRFLHGTFPYCDRAFEIRVSGLARAGNTSTTDR